MPGSEDWSSDLSSRSARSTVACVTSKGKHSLRPASWEGWRRRAWITPLFGTLLNPSRASSTAERWISSQLGSRASRGAAPARKNEQRTTDGSGQQLGTPFAGYDQKSSTWKMSQRSLGEESNTFSGPWPNSGSMRNGACYRRRPLDVPRSGNGSLYWATIKATDLQRGTSPRERARKTRSLLLQIKDWYGDPRVTPNLDFVESLQGLPIGWTDGELSGTQLSRWWRLMRSALSRLGPGCER